MDTIRGLPEVEEKGAREGLGCLDARSKAMRDFQGLGPPDLCRISKTSGDKQKEAATFFHYVIGLDVASSSRVREYVKSIMDAQETVAWLSSMFTSGRWTIHGGIYCCYNAFERVDVRVEVKFPGMVVEYGVDAYGNEVALDAMAWQGARLSAMLRSLEPPPQRLPTLMALPMFGDLETVEAFVDTGSAFFKHGEGLGLKALTNNLAEHLGRYLVRSRRLDRAVQVLWALHDVNPAALIHVARAYVKYDQLDSALQIISEALKSHPDDGPLLNFEAKLLLKKTGCEEMALEAAELAVQIQPTTWQFWVTLARAFAKNKMYEKALLALNSQVLALNRHDVENEVGLPDLSRAEQTVPKSGPVHLGLFALEPDDYEPLTCAGDSVMFRGFGQGFGLNTDLDETIAPIAADAGEKNVLLALRNCPGTSLSHSERRGYAVLVALHQELGWDTLVDKQSNVILIVEEGADKDLPACGPKRTYSTKYFDRLFEALHGDLCLLDHWHREQGARILSGSSELWLQRGALAERLQLDYDMELAFRIAQSRCICLRASLLLLRLYVKQGRAENAVAQLSVLCGVTLTALRSDQHPLLPKDCIPDWLFDAAAQVVCNLGLEYTKTWTSTMRPSYPFQDMALQNAYQDRMKELLAKLEKSGIDGVDR